MNDSNYRWVSSCFFTLFVPLSQFFDQKIPLPINFVRRRSSMLVNLFPSKFSILLFAFLSILPNYLSYIALGLTTLAENISITCTSAYLVYLVNVYRGRECYSSPKLIAIGISIIGIYLLSCTSEPSKSIHEDSTIISYTPLFNSDMESTRMYGNLLSFVAIIFHSLFDIYYEEIFDNRKESISTCLNIFGMIGIISSLLFWIPLVFLHHAELEIFELPKLSLFISLLLISVFYAVNTFASIVGTIKMSAMFPYWSSMFMLPLTVLLEYLFTKTFPGWSSLLGLALIFLSFVLFSYGDYSVKYGKLPQETSF